MSNCGECRKELAAGLVFCPACGRPLGSGWTAQGPPHEPGPPARSPAGSARRGPASIPPAAPPVTPAQAPGAPWQPPPAGWQAWPAGHPWPRTTGWAVCSLIFAFLCAPVGFVCSLVALIQIQGSGGRLVGQGYAVTGLVISVLMLFMWLAGAAG